MDPNMPSGSPAPAPVDVAPAAPMPAAAPAAPIQSPATPVPGAQPSSFSSGGFLSGVSPVRVGMFLLTSLALIYSIYYSRQAIKNLKTTKTADRRDIDELKGNVQSIMGENYKTL